MQCRTVKCRSTSCQSSHLSDQSRPLECTDSSTEYISLHDGRIRALECRSISIVLSTDAMDRLRSLLQTTAINNVFKRNSIFVSTIFAGAFAFGIGFDLAMTRIWEVRAIFLRSAMWNDTG